MPALNNDKETYALGSLVSGVVIERDGKFLLVQEKQAHVYGLWHLPAGHVDEGETLEQAAQREAEEETGIKLAIGEQLLVIHRTVQEPTLHAYRGLNPTGEVHFDPEEILDARWFSYQEIVALKKQLRDPEYALRAIDAFRKNADD